ncbi:hypothetical protein [Ciceribacter selenitireducens]|nr:hypothetical protein [Ciceribacter selenitireducens]
MTDNGPRLIGRKEAAAYCNITPTAFSGWVRTHIMPPAIPGTRKWDKKAIDAKLDEISGLAGNDNNPVDEFEKWEREKRQVVDRPSDSLSEWREKKEKRRAKYQPRMGLDAKHERVLLFMAERPDCDTPGMIPGAGPAVIQHLVTVGALKHAPGDRYELTDEGRLEVVRIRKWWNLAP